MVTLIMQTRVHTPGLRHTGARWCLYFQAFACPRASGVVSLQF